MDEQPPTASDPLGHSAGFEAGNFDPAQFATTQRAPALPSQPLQPQVIYVPMQVPAQFPAQVPALTRTFPWGQLTGALFAALGLLAFFALPFFDAQIISVSGVQLATSYGAKDLWLTVGTEILALFLCLAALSTPNASHVVRLFTSVLAGIFALVSAVPLYEIYSALGSYIPNSASTSVLPLTSFLGSGFWLCNVSALGVFLGCVVAIIAEM